MRKLDYVWGILLGLALYYVTSLSSAFWVSRETSADYSWSVSLGVVGAIVVGLFVARSAGRAIVTSVAVIVLVVVGFLVGSEGDTFAAPLPLDFLSLFLHGARSPIVIFLGVIIGAFGIGDLGKIPGARSTSNEAPAVEDVRV